MAEEEAVNLFINHKKIFDFRSPLFWIIAQIFDPSLKKKKKKKKTPFDFDAAIADGAAASEPSTGESKKKSLPSEDIEILVGDVEKQDGEDGTCCSLSYPSDNGKRWPCTASDCRVSAGICWNVLDFLTVIPVSIDASNAVCVPMPLLSIAYP